MVSIFHNKPPKAVGVNTKSITLRDFSGGLNVVDNDSSLSTRYSKRLKNFYRGTDKTNVLREGTRWFADVQDEVEGIIIDIVHFNGSLIVFMDSGEIARVTSAAVVSSIWNDTIAGALPGTPDGWSDEFTTIDTTEFRGNLLVHNGVDKPLIIDPDFDVEYLNDPSTGSNVNTPIGKYATTAADYHIIAGIASSPTELFISSRGTSGVFVGDADPNDGISIDVGAYSPQDSDTIKGIMGFRSSLIIMFSGATVVMQLGQYDSDGNHAPAPTDTIPRFGIINHRCIVPVENDLLFMDVIGMNSLKRNVFSGAIESQRLSDIVAPELQNAVAAQDDNQRDIRCFAVHNRLLKQYMFFTSETGYENDIAQRCFVMSFSEGLRSYAWSVYEGWDWTCGCQTYLGRVFFGKGTKLFRLGNQPFNEQVTADYVDDRDGEWAVDTSYSVDDLIYDTVTEEVYLCNEAHTSAASGTFAEDRELNPSYWSLYIGEPIEFDWELPWLDGRDRMKLKRINYVSPDTRGTATFNLKLYVDYLYVDADDNEVYDPAVDLQYVAGNSPGYGQGEQLYGGGRRAADARLWSYPVKFKVAKIRVTGSTRQPLRIIGISFTFTTGGFKR